MSSTDAITLPPVSMANLDVVAALVAAVGWPHRRADIAALIELGRGRLARAGDGRTFGVGLWWPFGDTAARWELARSRPRRSARRGRADIDPPGNGVKLRGLPGPG